MAASTPIHEQSSTEENSTVRGETLLERLKTAENIQRQAKWETFIRQTKWKKDRLLGSGVQAEVYSMLSEETENRQSCARKTIRYTTPNIVDRIKQECNLFTLTYHPNIVQYYDFAIDHKKQRVYIFMELMHVTKSIYPNEKNV